MSERPLLAITMGDPAGVGPEVAARALTDPHAADRCRPFVVGSGAAMEIALRLVGSTTPVRVVRSAAEVEGTSSAVEVLDDGRLDIRQIVAGRLSAAAGDAAVRWVLTAGNLALGGEVAAIVTGPINKEACSLAGHKDIGHTELFKRQAGAAQVATMLMTPNLRVVHLTTHRSLRVACDYVTTANVLAALQLIHGHFQGWGFPRPRIGVAALNPHASDGGLIGDEEARAIAPAVQAAQALGMDATGPVPADTVFGQAIEGRFDVVLAMYHDQGHIPIKVYDWARSITLNLGLPFIRTSVDHGTAFDIAGKGVADATSLREALKVASCLASEGRLE